MKKLTVGKLAKARGIGVETVRYYEKRGLLPEPERLPSNYRVYSKDTINRVRFIKRAQELGFTLEEISELLALSEDEGADCGDICDKAEEKVKDIELRIKDLMAMKQAIRELRTYCPGKGKPLSECSILKHFYGETE